MKAVPMWEAETGVIYINPEYIATVRERDENHTEIEMSTGKVYIIHARIQVVMETLHAS